MSRPATRKRPRKRLSRVLSQILALKRLLQTNIPRLPLRRLRILNQYLNPKIQQDHRINIQRTAQLLHLPMAPLSSQIQMLNRLRSLLILSKHRLMTGILLLLSFRAIHTMSNLQHQRPAIIKKEILMIRLRMIPRRTMIARLRRRFN